MSFARKSFVLGILLLLVLAMGAVPLALAQDATPTVEATAEPTDEAGADTATTPVAEPDAATTPVVDPEAATTPVVEPGAATTPVAEPGAAAPGTLPQTGAVTTPSTGTLLVVIGALILAGGLAVALSRRRS